MATKHICDRCGAEVKSRSDFWELTLRRVEVPTSVKGLNRESVTKYERWELCEKCKKHIYVELHELSGDLHE